MASRPGEEGQGSRRTVNCRCMALSAQRIQMPVGKQSNPDHFSPVIPATAKRRPSFQQTVAPGLPDAMSPEAGQRAIEHAGISDAFSARRPNCRKSDGHRGCHCRFHRESGCVCPWKCRYSGAIDPSVETVAIAAIIRAGASNHLGIGCVNGRALLLQEHFLCDRRRFALQCPGMRCMAAERAGRWRASGKK